MTGKRAGRVMATVAGLAALATGCTNTQLQGDSSSYLIINSLQAASVQSAGAASPTFGGVLDSDVCVHPVVDNVVLACPAIVGDRSVFEDLGKVSLTLALKNPGSAASPTSPTAANFITISQYHVDFIRSDGRNTPGVDVPYSFDGAVTGTITGDGGALSFPLVRVQAKFEAPLSGLANLGTTVSISTIAKVTFYGTDQAGRDVSVAGQISVNFADWADPKSGSGS
jgi:hypothetical protein